jgi:hypothetical protein
VNAWNYLVASNPNFNRYSGWLKNPVQREAKDEKAMDIYEMFGGKSIYDDALKRYNILVNKGINVSDMPGMTAGTANKVISGLRETATTGKPNWLSSASTYSDYDPFARLRRKKRMV